MDNTDNNVRNHNWIRSLAVNAVIALTIMLTTKLAYETNDDFVIASRIVEGYPEAFFVNYYLCAPLAWLQKLLPGPNVYVISQLIASFASFTCIFKLILDRSERFIVPLVSAVVIALFSLDHYCALQFTKTAAIATTAAVMLMVDIVIRDRGVGYWILGAVLLWYGSCLRVDGLIVMLGYAGLYVLKAVIDNRKELREKINARRVIACIVMLLMIAGCYGLKKASYIANTRTPELAEYAEYNDLRSWVVDYSVLDDYEKNRAKFDEAGLSENDIKLIRSWFFDYDGSASKENLQKILDISDYPDAQRLSPKEAASEFTKATVRSLRDFGSTGIHIMVLALLALWLLVEGNATGRLFALGAGCATAVLHLYLYYIQRPAYRATYVPDVCAAMWLLYVLAEMRGINARKIVCGAAVAVLSAALIYPAYVNAANTYDSNTGRIMSAEMQTYLGDRRDTFFVFDTGEKKSDPSYLTPLKAPDTQNERNVLGAGSWGTLSPYLLDKLGRYGLHNPIKDLIDAGNAYYVGNKKVELLTEYYNKWYGDKDTAIYMTEAGEADGIKVWKVSRGPAGAQ